MAGIRINDRETPAYTHYDDGTHDGFIPAVGSHDYYRRGGSAAENAAVPAAYAAINLLTDQLGMLPRRVVTKANIETTHQVNALLAFPSRMVDPAQFWQIMIRSLIASGNAYAWIRRDFITNRAIELVPAYVTRSEWVQARHSPYQRYHLRLMGTGLDGLVFDRYQKADARDVIAFHGPGFNGLRSPSPIMYAARKQATTMSRISEHLSQLLGEGVNTGMALTVDSEMAANQKIEVFQVWRDRLEEEYAGARNAGRVPVLPPGIKLERAQALSANDLQLIELLKWGVEDMARVFGVSPIRLGHYYQGMRVRGFEMQAVDFERYSILPKTHIIDTQLSWKLLSETDHVNGLVIRSKTDMVSMGSLSERADVVDQLVSKAGVLTINEGREIIGKQAHPDGDKLLQPKGAPTQDAPSQGMPAAGEE